MKNSFIIEEFYKGEKSTFYTIRFCSEPKSEADKFFQKFSSSEKDRIENIESKIERMANKSGCQDHYFKIEESSILNNICSLWEGNLRLYCLRYGNVAVVLGDGGIKDKPTYQEIPELNTIVNQLEEIFPLIDERIKDGEIIITDNEIIGDLIFKF
ncbi:MAG: hypothetical protein ISS16_00515 [Ignavibacteria bacterium]|nr:hypothetical protein [Ignavibacteria bacterium]